MDTDNFLVNDEYANEEVEHVYEDFDNLSFVDKKTIGVQLSATKNDTYSFSEELKGCFTLRECNELYGRSGGCKYTNSEVPEFDRCFTKGCISPLRRFTNQIGHFVQPDSQQNTSYPSIICFKPEILGSFTELGNALRSEIGSSVKRGKLWSISNCRQYTESDTNIWGTPKDELDSKISSALSILSVSFIAPLSAHTQHAWFEAQDSKDTITASNTFVQPEETTAGPGLYGTLHNNQQIDLAQEQNSKDINLDARYDDLDAPGFLCVGHTAHSTEAGRVRRVCCDVTVRVLNDRLLEKVYKGCDIADKQVVHPKRWLLFCMGKMLYCSTKALLSLRDFIVLSSFTNLNTATLHINNEMHTAILSISSGVLLKRDANKVPMCTTSLYSDDWPDNKYCIKLPDINTDVGLRFYSSAFFLLIPGIEYDRPPRQLISSVQSIQAVTAPYGAGTSSVAPSHISRPLITTPLAEAILANPQSKMADLIPGEDLVVALANFNDTNEDSIMISLDVIERGLFSHLAYSGYLVSNTESIPDVGEYANIYQNRWWKTYSKYQKEVPKPQRIPGVDNPVVPLTTGGDGRGKIISKSITDTGRISVKVLRYSTPVTGDKLASGHGQKGVIKWQKPEDMPWGIDDKNQPIRFDIIMSLSSITNRLTVGQYYEMVLGAKAAREGKRIVISPGQYTTEHNETNLYDGPTGEMIMRRSDDNKEDVELLASWGICRVWQMTQLSWDKQHYTHNTEGKYSVITKTGRTAGGGLRLGEMETHAMDSSGLTAVNSELKKRVDCIDTYVCLRCETLVQHHSCGIKDHFVPVSMPYALTILAHANILTTGHIMKFSVSPE